MTNEERARAIVGSLLLHNQYSGLSFLVADIAAALAAAEQRGAAAQAERDAQKAERWISSDCTCDACVALRDVAAAIRATAKVNE